MRVYYMVSLEEAKARASYSIDLTKNVWNSDVHVFMEY